MSQMTLSERRAVISLASLFSLRMIGLFMIIPVFAVYGRELEGVTPLLLGLAVGIYALAQALLQIPLSQWSDRVGRKPLIIAGMAMFAVGGVIAATSTSIWGVIIGRALQGAGAISGVVLALVADLTRLEQRTKAMAVVGMSIGVSFGVSFVLGPLLAAHFGLSGLFWSTALMGLLGIAVCLWAVPTPITITPAAPQSYREQFLQVLKLPALWRLNIGILVLHMVMAAFFMSVPVLLTNAGLIPAHHGWVYLPVLLLSFVLMVPAIIVAEKKRRMKSVFLSAIAILMLSLLSLAIWHQGWWALILGLMLFFMAFNLLEAMLPSLISKTAPAGSKGTAMGIYSTSQFAGAFIGSPLGAVLQSHAGYGVLFAGLAALVLLWWCLAAGMASPPALNTLVLSFEHLSAVEASTVAQQLREIAGVEEVVVLPDEKLAYLKVDAALLDEATLQALPAVVIKA